MSNHKTIWKYKLTPDGLITIEMPKGAQVLSVKPQGDDVCLWALVDPSAEVKDRKFMIFGTGHDVPNIDLCFIDTFMLFEGGLVFHVFEVV
jgi:hypothetical protein